jgi:hypothetical protein
MTGSTDADEGTDAVAPVSHDGERGDGAGADDGHESDPSGFVWNTDLSDGDPDADTDTSPDADTDTDTTPGAGAESESAAESVSATLQPEQYLLAGETVVERVDLGRGWVAATTHRVLVFDPEGEGRQFDSVDRPNVVGVRTTAGGDPDVLGHVSRAVLYAVSLFGGWLAARSVGLASLFSVPDAGGTPGFGGLLSMLSLAGRLLTLLVDALLVGGVVATLAAAVLAAWYLRGRHPALVVDRAGDGDVTLRLPTAAAGDRAVEALERALADELGDART